MSQDFNKQETTELPACLTEEIAKAITEMQNQVQKDDYTAWLETRRRLQIRYEQYFNKLDELSKGN
jgi:hypothetical protein